MFLNFIRLFNPFITAFPCHFPCAVTTFLTRKHVVKVNAKKGYLGIFTKNLNCLRFSWVYNIFFFNTSLQHFLFWVLLAVFEIIENYSALNVVIIHLTSHIRFDLVLLLKHDLIFSQEWNTWKRKSFIRKVCESYSY